MKAKVPLVQPIYESYDTHRTPSLTYLVVLQTGDPNLRLPY